MRSEEEILKRVPYREKLFLGIYRTRMKIGNLEGTVVWGANEDGWEHVSFSPFGGKLPGWNDMCILKNIFFEDEEEAIQIHPKKSEYINLKENCLHLWRYPGMKLPE